MKIFPAIDLRGGKVVRLFQGDYDKMTVYGDDPISVARGFQEKGASCLHVVDLDGAKDGVLVNDSIIREIATQVGMFVEVGGGIRDMARVESYLNAGVSRVIIGTSAVTDPDFLEAAVKKYGDKIAVGVDAKDGYVAINGWKEVTDIESFSFCKKLYDMGVSTVIYTDIAKDGGLGGTNIEAYAKLKEIKGLSVTASGGISSVEEIKTLSSLVDAAILGKALYDGKLDLAEAVKAGEGAEKI